MNETVKKMLSGEEVRDYLLANPDFFIEHQELFTQINFPHDTSGAVSLIERQVQVLREGQKQSQDQVSELTATATDNHELLKKMQLLTIKLIAADNSLSLITALDTLMKEEFQLDQTQLLMPDNLSHTGLPLTHFLSSEDVQKMHADIFNLDIYVGRVPTKLSQYFTDDSLKDIGSIALLKLEMHNTSGYLLLGSSDESRFQSDMATDFIEFVARVLSILLKQSLEQS